MISFFAFPADIRKVIQDAALKLLYMGLKNLDTGPAYAKKCMEQFDSANLTESDRRSVCVQMGEQVYTNLLTLPIELFEPARH